MIYFNEKLKKPFTKELNDKIVFKDSYTKAELEEIYYEHYLFNLSNLLNDEKLYLSWHHIEEISSGHYTAENTRFYLKDSYLREIAGENSLLAKDILINGTYWPIAVKNDGTSLILEKGGHRINGAKILKKRGEWDDRKFLCIEGISTREDRLKDYLVDNNIQLPRETRVRLPLLAMFPLSTDGDRYNEDPVEVENYIKSIGAEKIGENMVEISIYNYKQLFRCANYLCTWLREPIHHYNRDNPDDKIKANPIINDIAEFEKWKDNFLNRGIYVLQ